MLDQPEFPGIIPETPEVPGAIIWLRWLAHLAFGDLAVIRRTWQTILILAAAASVAIWFFDKERYEARLSNFDPAEHIDKSTIQNQSTTIEQLQDELKGTSPQLAAIQAGRDRIRQKLQEFYVQGGVLFNRGILKPEDIKSYGFEADAWANIAGAWVKYCWYVGQR